MVFSPFTCLFYTATCKCCFFWPSCSAVGQVWNVTASEDKWEGCSWEWLCVVNGSTMRRQLWIMSSFSWKRRIGKRGDHLCDGPCNDKHSSAMEWSQCAHTDLGHEQYLILCSLTCWAAAHQELQYRCFLIFHLITPVLLCNCGNLRFSLQY